MILNSEIKFYETNKDDLLEKYEGKVILIKGNKCIGAYPTEKAAYIAGLDLYGNEAFLIKKVTKEDDVAQNPALVLGML